MAPCKVVVVDVGLLEVAKLGFAGREVLENATSVEERRAEDNL